MRPSVVFSVKFFDSLSRRHQIFRVSSQELLPTRNASSTSTSILYFSFVLSLASVPIYHHTIIVLPAQNRMMRRP